MQHITQSQETGKCEEETQNNSVLILFSVMWDRKNIEQTFKILLYYLKNIPLIRFPALSIF